MEARDQKMARAIGMTSHTSGEVLAQAIQRHDLDCVQMALNASQNGRFEELALPAARTKNLGVIAMKVTGQEYLLKNDGWEKRHRFLVTVLDEPARNHCRCRHAAQGNARSQHRNRARVYRLPRERYGSPAQNLTTLP